MRFHPKTLSNHHRARFQLTAHRWAQLVKEGTIFQTVRCLRTVDGRVRAMPQQWYLVQGERHWPISNRGHGWYETTVARDADHLVDRQLLAKMRGLVGLLAVEIPQPDLTVTSIADYLEARAARNEADIRRGLHPIKVIDYLGMVPTVRPDPEMTAMFEQMRDRVTDHKVTLIGVNRMRTPPKEERPFEPDLSGLPTVTLRMTNHKAPTLERLEHLKTRFNRK